MASVTPGYSFTGSTDPVTATKLNLLGQPTVTLDTAEVENTNLNSAQGIGYVTGTGGTVTQSTNKGTTVVLNKPCGEITLNNATLNAATIVSFTLTNSVIAAGDLLILNHVSGGTVGAYTHTASCGSGSATIYVRNATAGNLSEAIVLRFALIKGVTA